ncbi:MAG: hypothetical protein U0N53_08865 [Ruthenibacterium sp.]|nr:hypothetical protein [Ruthenibacterium sp.]
MLTLCLVAGILLGAWLSSAALGGQEGNFISYYAAELLRVRCSSAFWQVFSSSLFSSFLCLSLLLLFAFSCFGAPCVIGLLWVEGCAFGAMNAALYGQMGTKGLFASAVLFLVPESVRFVCFTLTARRALQTSASLFAAQFLAREMHAQTGVCALRIYMAASIACMASAFLSGALCSIFCPVFLN